MSEKELMHLAVFVAVFWVGFTIGQRKAAAASAKADSAPAAPALLDSSAWFANGMGSWGGSHA